MADLRDLEFTEEFGGAPPEAGGPGFGISAFGTSRFGRDLQLLDVATVTTKTPAQDQVVSWIPDDLPDGNYSWRVRVTDSRGETSGWTEPRHITIKTSNAYTSTLVSDLSPLGALDPRVDTRKNLDGALGASEDYDGPGGYDSAALYDSGTEGAALDATLTIKRALHRSHGGFFDSAGAISGRVRKLIPAMLSFAGATLHTSRLHVASVLTFSATIAGRLVAILTAALVASGTTHLATKRSLASDLIQQAVLTSKARPSLSGTLVASSTHVEKVRRLVVGALALVSALFRGTSLESLAGAFGFSGATGRYTQRLVTGVLSFLGKVRPGRAFQGAVSLAGAVVRVVRPSLSTTLNMGGILRVRWWFSLTSALDMSADVTDLTRKTLTAILDTGATKAADVRMWLYAAVAPTGSALKHVAVSKVGVLTAGGVVPRLHRQTLEAVLGIITSLKPRVGLALTAVMSVITALGRRMSAMRYATLDLQGAIASRILLRLASVLDVQSETIGGWRTKIAIYGSASLASIMRRAMAARVAGALALNSAVERSMTRALTATMSWMSSLVTPRYSRRHLWADIWPKTAVRFSTMRGLSGILSPTAKTSRIIQRSFVAILSQTGSMTPIKSARVILGGALSWSGTIRRNLAIRITARLLLQGAVYKGNLRYLTGSIGPSGYMRKGLYWTLGSALELAASLTHRMTYPSFARPRRRLDVKNRFGGTQRYHPVDK